MADRMEFPKSVDEYMEQYKIVDSKEIYTNGSELVPIFRMKQWFEHIDQMQWIPCSSGRMPKEKDTGILKKLGIQKRSDSVIVTVDVNGERMTDLGYTHDGVWQWKMKYAFPDYKVIAWQTKPEPYRGGDADGNM